MENYLHPDSYSCRVGKGGLKAAQQFSEYVREVSENYTRDCWLFSLDLQGFFPSIDTNLWTRELVRFIDQYYDGEDKELVKYLTKLQLIKGCIVTVLGIAMYLAESVGGVILLPCFGKNIYEN